MIIEICEEPDAGIMAHLKKKIDNNAKGNIMQHKRSTSRIMKKIVRMTGLVLTFLMKS